MSQLPELDFEALDVGKIRHSEERPEDPPHLRLLQPVLPKRPHGARERAVQANETHLGLKGEELTMPMTRRVHPPGFPSSSSDTT